MKLISRRCSICDTFHNHLSCPYCGAVKVGSHHYNVANGRELVRGISLPRILASQVMPCIGRNDLPKIAQRASR